MDPNGDDGKITLNVISLPFVQGWYVEWMRITMSTGEVFSCLVDAWIDDGGTSPDFRTVPCSNLGDCCHLQVTWVTNKLASSKMRNLKTHRFASQQIDKRTI